MHTTAELAGEGQAMQALARQQFALTSVPHTHRVEGMHRSSRYGAGAYGEPGALPGGRLGLGARPRELRGPSD